MLLIKTKPLFNTQNTNKPIRKYQPNESWTTNQINQEIPANESGNDNKLSRKYKYKLKIELVYFSDGVQLY